VKVLCARGGFKVDIAWKQGKHKSAAIKNISGTTCKVRYGNKITSLKIMLGEEKKLNEKLR
jgi:alpha-L-fucosidase 2